MKRGRTGAAKKTKVVKEVATDQEPKNDKEDANNINGPVKSKIPGIRSIDESWDAIEGWLKTNEPADFALIQSCTGTPSLSLQFPVFLYSRFIN